MANAAVAASASPAAAAAAGGTAAAEEYLAGSPSDAVSRVQFLDTPSVASGDLLAASWDCTVRLFQSESGRLVTSVAFNAPVLDACSLRPLSAGAGADEECYSFLAGTLQKEVYLADFNRPDAKRLLGTHREPVRRVAVLPARHAAFSGAWDRQVKMWDDRTRAQTDLLQGIRGKVFALAAGTAGSRGSDFVLVGDSERLLYIYDLRNLAAPMEVRENTVKAQIRDIAVSPDCAVCTLAAVEGRVSWEYMPDSGGRESGGRRSGGRESGGRGGAAISDGTASGAAAAGAAAASGAPAKKKAYTFKCHREKTEGGREIVHRVNTIAFHAPSGAFATGGSDGGVSFWDGYQKKRLWRLPEPVALPVASVSVSADPEEPVLALGLSNDFAPGGGVLLRKMRPNLAPK